MAQIQNFGFMPPVQELDVQHPTRPCSRIGQFRRLTKGTQHALCHPYHTGTHGQGLGSDLPFGNDHQQLPYGAVPAVQVPPSEGAGTSGHPLFRCVGGHLRQEDNRLRVQCNQQHRAEGTFPLLHQGSRIGGILQ